MTGQGARRLEINLSFCFFKDRSWVALSILYPFSFTPFSLKIFQSASVRHLTAATAAVRACAFVHA